MNNVIDLEERMGHFTLSADPVPFYVYWLARIFGKRIESFDPDCGTSVFYLWRGALYLWREGLN